MSAAGRGRFADADAVLREHGRTFTWARRFLGRRQAARATHLYAFCRYLDDVADEGYDRRAASRALESVRADLVAGRSEDPCVATFLAQFTARPAVQAAALALIDGVARDLAQVAFESERELMRYCYRVAGTVGVMMCDVLDQPDPAAAPFAVDLGIAMQLTNIARDVHEDARRGRRYLPAELVAGASAQSLVDLEGGAHVGARQTLLDRAEAYYESGRRGLAFLPLRARFAILIAAENYRAIGVRARALGDRVEVRAVVSPVAKLWITVGAVLGAFVRPSFWVRPRRHEGRLHRHLEGLGGVHLEDHVVA